jgi:hypothetical protein
MDGQARELEALYETRYTLFRNALATVTGSRESARDAVEEAFARARCGTGRPPPGRLEQSRGQGGRAGRPGDQGARRPRGVGHDVDAVGRADEGRRLLHEHLPGRLHYDRLGVGVGLFGRVAPDGEILTGRVVLQGETTNERADSLLLRFQDGERQSIPLVWVGEPVNTAFFLYGVPERWGEGHPPTTLTLLAADGDELDTREISGITTKGLLNPR